MKKADAIKAFKNRTALATSIGITKQAVSGWGDLVPEGSAAKLLIENPKIPHIKIKENNS